MDNVKTSLKKKKKIGQRHIFEQITSRRKNSPSPGPSQLRKILLLFPLSGIYGFDEDSTSQLNYSNLQVIRNPHNMDSKTPDKKHFNVPK